MRRKMTISLLFQTRTAPRPRGDRGHPSPLPPAAGRRRRRPGRYPAPRRTRSPRGYHTWPLSPPFEVLSNTDGRTLSLADIEAAAVLPPYRCPRRPSPRQPPPSAAKISSMARRCHDAAGRGQSGPLTGGPSRPSEGCFGLHRSRLGEHRRGHRPRRLRPSLRRTCHLRRAVAVKRVRRPSAPRSRTLPDAHAAAHRPRPGRPSSDRGLAPSEATATAASPYPATPVDRSESTAVARASTSSREFLERKCRRRIVRLRRSAAIGHRPSTHHAPLSWLELVARVSHVGGGICSFREHCPHNCLYLFGSITFRDTY